MLKEFHFVTLKKYVQFHIGTTEFVYPNLRKWHFANLAMLHYEIKLFTLS